MLNLFDTGNLVHLKTVPLMEELEAVVCCTPRFSKKFLGGSNASNKLKRKIGAGIIEFVLIAAGERGILQICRVGYEVRCLLSSLFQ